MITSIRATFIFVLLFVSSFLAHAANKEPVVSLGESSSIHSKALDKEVPLSIHLPENYDSSKNNYPVIYMMGSDFKARFALLASTLDVMADRQIPPMILIGVDLPDGNFVLVPNRQTADTKSPDTYLAFVQNELIPHVDATYRTAPFRMLFGASNSGFFSTYALLKKPELFNSYMASSPMYAWAPEVLKSQIEQGPLKKLGEKRYLHIIYSDDDFVEVTESVPDFTDTLNKHKPQKLSYHVTKLVNEGHVPATDFTSLLMAQYPNFNAHETLDSVEKIQSHFAKLSKSYGYTMLPSMSMVFDLGTDLVRAKDFAAAKKTFHYALKIYPESKRAHFGMGYLHRAKGNIEDAKIMFKKALAIDPDYGLAKRFLERLES